MKLYYDNKGESPLSIFELKALIEEGTFYIAWRTVCIYIMKMDLSPFHIALMKHRLSSPKTLTMAGRGLGKSFLLTTSYTLTHILRDRDIAIAIITKTQDLSKGFVTELKSIVERKNGIIMEIFGEIKDPTEWNKLEFKVIREVDRPEATVTACSIFAPGTIVGKHYDILLLDDITDTKTSMTKYMRDGTEDQLYNQVLPAMHPQTDYRFIHMVGTHYHWDDIYTRMEEKETYSTLKVPAILIDDKGNEYCCWEGASEATVKQIFEIREENPLAYKQQYQQIVERGDGGVFNREWIQYFNKMDVKGNVYCYYPDEEGKTRKEQVRVYMGVDPAISKKDSADNFALAVIGIGEKTGYIYLLDLLKGKFSFSEQMSAIKKMGAKWPMVLRITIESVAYQTVLSEELQRTTGLPISKIKTTTDKMTRFTQFSGQWENEKVFLLHSLTELSPLTEELLGFPDAEHDDLIDAFCIAWEGQRNKKPVDLTGISITDFGF